MAINILILKRGEGRDWFSSGKKGACLKEKKRSTLLFTNLTKTYIT
jgi:hypothetical protein